MSALRLITDGLAVEILPDDGCDIYSIVDRLSGVDVLWKAPWGRRTGVAQPWTSDSESQWMSRLSGGWQVLLPHAGDARTVDGAPRGFHGEAGMIAWNVESVETNAAAFSVGLLTAPLRVNRRVELDGLTVIVEEEVINESPDPATFAWGHHPTFGAPLVAPGARIEVAARTQTLDGSTVAQPWPVADGVVWSVVPAEPHASLRYLQHLDTGVYRLVNDQLQLGVEMRWPLETFPNVWLWQELGGSAGYPWFRRGYAIGIEPQSTVPQGGVPSLVLGAGQRRSVRLELQILRG